MKNISSRLEWDSPNYLNNYCHVAKTPIGDYYVDIDGGKHQAWFNPDQPDEDIGGPSGSLETEQAKCQDHYEELVRSLIDPKAITYYENN